jgi:hypothetical protein
VRPLVDIVGERVLIGVNNSDPSLMVKVFNFFADEVIAVGTVHVLELLL